MMSDVQRSAPTSGEHRVRVLDLINTDKSARELLDRRVSQINSSDRFENAICCNAGEAVDDLRARGHRVFVVSTPRGLSPVQLTSSVWKAFRLLRRERFDIVHTHGTVIGVIGRMAAFLARTPIVVHQVHGFHHHEHMSAWTRRFSIWIERLMGWVTDRCLFQTPADRDQAVRIGIARADRCSVIGNGVDLSVFHPVQGPPHSPAVIFCAARFEPVKNHGLLLQAVEILQDRAVGFHLKLAGEGEEQSRWEQWVHARGLGDKVAFLGYRLDIPALTADADICVLTSIKEGVPRAIMEAGACARPMVATDVSGNRDALQHGRTGFLVSLESPEQLADRLEELLKDKTLRVELGNNALSYALEHFDEKKVVERIMVDYDEAIQRSPRFAKRIAVKAATPNG